MYQRILVPVDGSPAAACGVQAAIDLARLFGGRIRLIHLVDDLSHVTGYETAATYLGEVKPALHRRAQDMLDEARERVARAGVPVECALLEDRVADVAGVVKLDVQTWKADIVVMGTHGRRGTDRLLIGSDAEACARVAGVPVLLVRPPRTAVPEAPSRRQAEAPAT